MRRTLAILALVVTLSSFGEPATGKPRVICWSHRVRVALAAGASKAYSVWSSLCVPEGVKHPTVHVLVSGGSYGHGYWDFPYRPDVYSYVRALTRAGYATLNVDRIGIGRSSRPPASDVTIESNAFVIHQIIGTLRRSAIGGTRFERVVIVGHSLGVGIVWVEAATYHDVDGVIVSDGMHTPASGLWVAIASFYPAQLESRFASTPPGYLTTVAGRRGAIFYYAPGADPKVTAIDEATKETATWAELATLPLSTDPSISEAINVPVLSVVGEFDANFCDIPCSDPSSPAPSREPSYYSPKACLEIFVSPRSGHDVNLHRSAPIWYRKAIEWSNRRVGRTANAKAKRC